MFNLCRNFLLSGTYKINEIHHENTPYKSIVKILPPETESSDFFFHISAQKAVLASTNNLCFWAEIR